MTNQSDTTSRPLIWEDDAPAESRFRRVRRGVPPDGRTLPGMPLEMPDPDGEDLPRKKWSSMNRRASWWWPASTAGRVCIALGAFIILGALTAAGEILKAYVERDARFRIVGASQIEATGLAQVSRADMLPVFGEDIGRNIFFVPLTERRRQLESIPWIEHATVMRVLPDQIRVDIVERQPVAFTRRGQQIGLVDANGVLLDMLPAAMAAHHYSFPVITGIDPNDPPAARQQRMSVYMHLMGELDANNQHYSEQVSEIDLTDPEDARALMPEQGTDILAHFGEDHFLERYQRYKDHIAEWRQQYPHLAAVDLRYNKQVVLEMASGTNSEPSSANPPAAPFTANTPARNAAPPAASAKGSDAPAKPVASKSAVKPASPAGKAQARTSASNKTKTAAKAKSPAKARNTAKSKAAASKHKAQQQKKRAQSKSVAQKVNRKKPAAATHPAATEGQ